MIQFLQNIYNVVAYFINIVIPDPSNIIGGGSNCVEAPISPVQDTLITFFRVLGIFGLIIAVISTIWSMKIINKKKDDKRKIAKPTVAIRCAVIGLVIVCLAIIVGRVVSDWFPMYYCTLEFSQKT